MTQPNRENKNLTKITPFSDSTIRVFISYRNIAPSDVEAERLAERLQQANLPSERIFFDQIRLKAGDIWAQEIFNNIRQSDVLIVLLQVGRNNPSDSTAHSEWVQREVDVARGGHISILPIKLMGQDDLLITSQVTTYLEIRDRQFLTYSSFEHQKKYLYESHRADLFVGIPYDKLESEQKKKVKDTYIKSLRDRLEELQANTIEKSHKFPESENAFDDLNETEQIQYIEAYRKTYESYDGLDPEEQTQCCNDYFKSLPVDEQFEIENDNIIKFNELVELINTLSFRTRNEQRKWMADLRQLRHKDHAQNNYRAYQQPINKSSTLYLATGDLTELPMADNETIDVIVNSENDYMQLARMFELNSLSVSLRLKGAYFENGRLMSDYVQDQLNQLIKRGYKKQGLPVMVGEVLATYAGHPKSILRRRGFRYIFHAATIHYDPIYSDEPAKPVNSRLGISTVVRNCLDTVNHLNATKGNIFALLPDDGDAPHPSDTDDHMDYKPIQSIIFPLFSTGQAGQSVQKVVGPILEGMKSWFDENADSSIKEVYLSVFLQDHVEVVEKEMDRIFGKLKKTDISTT